MSRRLTDWQAAPTLPPGIQVVISFPHERKAETIRRMKQLAHRLGLQTIIAKTHVDEQNSKLQYYEIIVTVKKPLTTKEEHNKVSAALVHFQSLLMAAVTASNMPEETIKVLQ